MSVTSEPKRCPKCGMPIPEEAPQGLCPKCLLMQASIPTEGGKSDSPEWQPPTQQEIAAAFPQLEILEVIGRGGMGLVFKARQPKLERLVALKILPQSLAADAAFAERFIREGRVLARLNHPNIVTIHDFGQANGFFFLLMEFVDGVNLRQAMRAGRFTPAQALAVVPKICDALQFAHNEGVLHRDIKPENILVDSKGRVKIADFGIAKLVGEPRPAEAITGSGAILGTPHYMAPEQLEKPDTVDHRADIYSLGVVFYEMLTGELPLGRFQPPSHKVEMDVRLDEVVLHALEKEPERRYQQAGQVKTAVETITSTPQPLPASAARNRVWRTPATAMAFICLALVAATLWFAMSLVSAHRSARAAEEASVAAAAANKASALMREKMVMDQAELTDGQMDIVRDGGFGWNFKTLLPANQLAQMFLVFWTNGTPRIYSGSAAYVKVKSEPIVLSMLLSCRPVKKPRNGGTNVANWGFLIAGFNENTDSSWVSNQPPYRKLDIARSTLQLPSGHQLIIPMVQFDGTDWAKSNGWSGVELRVLLQPLRRPAVITTPEEQDKVGYIGGLGIEGARKPRLRRQQSYFGLGVAETHPLMEDPLIREMPEVRAETTLTDQRLVPGGAN
jgi:serine/threonine protein kinase